MIQIQRREQFTKAADRHNREPLVCKHLAAVVIYLRALQAMRRAARSH